MLSRSNDIHSWTGTVILSLMLGPIIFLIFAKILSYLDRLRHEDNSLTSLDVPDKIGEQKYNFVPDTGPDADGTEPHAHVHSIPTNTQIALVNPSTKKVLRQIRVQDLEDGPPEAIIEGTPPELNFVARRQLAIPTRIPCRLVILKVDENKEITIPHQNLFLIEWQDCSAFEQCRRAAEDVIRPGAGCELYINTKHFRIMKVSSPPQPDTWVGQRELQRQTHGDGKGVGEIEVYVGSIDKDREWGEQLQIRLAYHLSIDRPSVFLLEVTLSFTIIRPHDIGSCNGKDCIRNVGIDLFNRQIAVKSHDPYIKKSFIPDRYLNKYFSIKLIKHLIVQNENLRKLLTTPEQVETLVHFIHGQALRIFAGCILADRDIGCMYSFEQAQIHDTNIFQSSADSPTKWDVELKDKTLMLLKKHFPSMPAEITLDKLEKEFPLVKAYIFKTSNRHQERPPHSTSEPQHVVIPSNTVLPIVERSVLGDGGSGLVDRVRIHEDHHDFSGNKRELFALKAILRDPEHWKGQHDRDKHIDKEKDNLQLLAKVPHPHLTPMLGSWSQGQECLILMPLAEQDLHHFVTDVRGPSKFDETFLRWLFSQTLGLAEGLKFFHNHWGGYHHDLRLKNILVFSGDILKISDFGTARINAFGQSDRKSYSHHTRQRLSTAGYHAPDLEKMDVLSKPQDGWSLGCIFLELIVWAFGESVQEFADDRSKVPLRPGGGVSSQGFWCQMIKVKDGVPQRGVLEYVLKPCVTEMITKLKTHERREDSLTAFLGVVEGMLRIDAYESIDGDVNHVISKTGAHYRDDMKNVVDKLGKIKNEADLNLKKRRSTNTNDIASQEGTVVTKRNHTRRPLGDSLSVRGGIQGAAFSPPSAEHKLDLPDLITAQSKQDGGDLKSNLDQSEDKGVLQLSEDRDFEGEGEYDSERSSSGGSTS